MWTAMLTNFFLVAIRNLQRNRGYAFINIAGLAIGMAVVILIGMWMTPTERGRAAALLDGGAPLGTALGSLIIAGLIAAFGSWRLAFLAAGLGTNLHEQG